MPASCVIRIAPSILAADFTCLERQVRAVEAAGVEVLHLDVMDGHFVPNISFGPLVVRALRPVTKLLLDTHLMIQHPERYVEAFLAAGSDLITVHCEAAGDPAGALAIVRGAGRKTGIAVNPDTPFEQALPYAADVDLILIMSVHPGFGGQSFMREVLPKFRQAREAGRPGALYEIDGGISTETIAEAARAGANLIVAGTSVFGQPDPAAACRELRDLGNAALPAGP